LRRRDAEFAEQYDAAHEMSKLHLEELTIQYAKTGGRTVAVEPGEIAPVDMAHFDPDLALRILQRPRPSQRPYRGRTGRPPQRASKAELIAAINNLLDVAERRQAKRNG
jgi:NAD(P)-dependent dehydrogenase (short-subunit alcohol dehydrogenase family)